MKKIYSILQLTALFLGAAVPTYGNAGWTNKEKPKVVKLVPPALDQKVILEKIGCARPFREGMFDITA